MSQGVQSPLSQELTATLGPQLLGYVRTLDAAGSSLDSASDAIDNAIPRLHTLIGVASRQGILQNDIKMAESLLMATAAASSSQQQLSFKKKRKSTTTDDINAPHKGNSSGLSTTFPAQLVMTAILRIFGLKDTASLTADIIANQALLTALAADLIRAVVQHARRGSSGPAICVQAECVWLRNSTKSVLSALSQILSKLIPTLQHAPSSSNVEIRHAIASCLYASADLIALTGTRLSRSQAVLTSLEQTAWQAMACSTLASQPVVTLLAALPLAGGTERATPAVLWTKRLQNVQGLASKLIEKSLPTSQRIKTNQKTPISTSTELEKRFDGWWTTLHQMELQQDRVALVLHLIQSLVSLLIALLRQGHNTMVLLEASLNITSLLDLVDALLSVPMSAEATYYGTKKRLRDEPLDSGVLSPTSVVTLLANHLYIQGQRLLSNVVTILGAPSLLPYAQRLRQVGYASVLTSCSPTLRQVLEPGYNIAKKRRWLPHSLVTRTSALRTLQALTITLGIKAASERAKSRKRFSAQEMDRMVKVVSGCLLEQLYPHNDDNLDWGSRQEQTDLVMTTTECLSSMLVSGGEFLTMEARQLTESVAATCLSYMRQPTASLSSTLLWKNFLELGKACVSTSWPDGASSALRGTLRQAAQSASGTGDASLDQVAASARQLCDSLSHPTVPALYVVTRQKEDPPMVQELTAKMEQARVDAKARKAREQKEESQRKKAKVEKKTANQTTATVNENESPKTSKTEVPVPPANKEVSDASTSATTLETSKADASGKGAEAQELELKDKKSPDATAKEASVSPAARKADPEPLRMPAGKPPLAPTTRGGLKNDEESDLDEDFPMIVDAAPDEDDVDDDDE